MKSWICGFAAMAIMVGGATGCSFKKSLDDTKSATDEMKESTKKIGSDSDVLASRTEFMDSELTYDRSYFAMRQNFAWMWGEEAGPNPSNEAGMMLDAGAAMKSMWLQFWKGDYGDTLSILDERFVDGADVLLVSVKAHSTFSHPVDVLNPDRNFTGCSSLAAKLDFVRPEFTRAAIKSGLGPFTFYDLIVMALRDRDQLVHKGPFPLAVAKILQYQQDAIYLLQLRHNYLPMLVMASLTPFSDEGGLGRAGSLASAWMGRKETVNLAQFSKDQLKEWTQWLKLAKQTRDDLKSMGIEPQYNWSFRTLINRVDFGQERMLVEPATDELGKLQHDFAQAYSDVTKP